MAITQTAAKYPAPIIFAAGGDKLDREMLIREAYWVSATTAGDDLVISDYDSTATLFECKAAANDVIPITPLFGQRVDGIKVTTLDHGKVLIYL